MQKTRKPCLKDVAELAGVSTATVSFVLNNTRSISAPTRARVEEALAKLDYRISRSARALRTGHHHAIGLLLPDLINPFFPALAQAVTASAWKQGYALILASSDAGPTEEMEAFHTLAERTDGIIWIPGTHAKPTGSPLSTVILDRPSKQLSGYDSVSCDHYAGGALVAALFRARSRTHVGLLRGPSSSPSATSRCKGFLDNCDGLEVIWRHSVPFSLDLPESTISLLADPRLDAIFAANDVIAIGAARHLRELGRKVPDDVAIVGFDDIPWASLVETPLTTIRQPMIELGTCAVDTLIRRIKNPPLEVTHQWLPVSLVERASTIVPLKKSPLKKPKSTKTNQTTERGEYRSC